MVFLQQIINGLAVGSIYALIAIGWTTVFGIVGVINWTHGEIFMFGAFSGYFCITKLHMSFFPALCVAMLIAGGIAVLTDKLFYKPLRTAVKLALFITALGASTFYRYLASVLWSPNPRAYPAVLKFKMIELLHVGDETLSISNLHLMILLITIAIMVMLQLFISKTKMGKAMLAASQDFDTVGLMGVEANRLITLTFFISGMLGGAAGVMVGTLYAIDPMMGAMAGLKGWSVAILGGVGSITGSMIAGVCLGIAESLTSGFISTGYRDAISFIIMILVLVIKPTGFLGFKFDEKV